METMASSQGTNDRKPSVEVAFALAGLSGNNAFGAGVVQAAYDAGVRPDLISCTSGQLLWVHRYLLACRTAPRGPLLRQELENDIKEYNPTGVEVFDSLWFGIMGKPGEFRPTLLEMPMNMTANWATAMAHIATNSMNNPRSLFSCYRELATVIPAQSLTPRFPEAFFREVSDNLSYTSDVGVAFNSYEVHSGDERVYLNERARDVGRRVWREQPLSSALDLLPHYPECSARVLWIFEYGPPKGVSRVDGAYYRQVMLSEMAPARTIYVARPINDRWTEELPTSWSGLQCLKTAVNFNGSYSAERDKICLVNRLIKENMLRSEVIASKGYHEIKLIEIEPELNPDFFDYAHESLNLFDEAYEKARTVFQTNEKARRVFNQVPERARAVVEDANRVLLERVT